MDTPRDPHDPAFGLGTPKPTRLAQMAAAVTLGPDDYAAIVAMIASETTADVSAGAFEIPVTRNDSRYVAGGFACVSAFDPRLSCEIRRIKDVKETEDGRRVIELCNAPGKGMNPLRFDHPKGSTVFPLTDGVANVLYWLANPSDIADDSRAKLQAANDDASGLGGSYGKVYHPFGQYGISGSLEVESYQEWTGVGPQSSVIVANLQFIVPPGEHRAMVVGRRRNWPEVGKTALGSREGAPTMRFSVNGVGLNGGHMPGVSGTALCLQQQSAWYNWTIRNCPEAGLWISGQQCHFYNSQVLFCGDAVYCANFLLGNFYGINIEGSTRSDFVFDMLPGGQWSSQIAIYGYHQEGHPAPYPKGHPQYVAGRKFAPPRVRMVAGFDISIHDALVKGGDDTVIIAQENPLGAFYTIVNMRIDYATPSTVAIRDVYGGDDLLATRDFGNHIGFFQQIVEMDSPAAPVANMIRGKGNRYIKKSINQAGKPFLDIATGNGDGMSATSDVGNPVHARTTSGPPLHTESESGGVLHERDGSDTTAGLHIVNGRKRDHSGTTKGTAGIIENDELGIGLEVANTNPDNLEPAAVYSVGPKARNVVVYRGAAITQQDQSGRQLYSVSPSGDVWFSRVADDGTARDTATVTSGITGPSGRSSYLQLSVAGPDGIPLPALRIESRDGVTCFGVHGKCAPQAPALPARTGRQTISREATRIDAIEAYLVASGQMAAPVKK